RTNLYSVFSELTSRLLTTNGRNGIIIPTGIATDDTNKDFFANLVENNSLVSLFDFENRKKLFPEVDSRQKFCLLSTSGGELEKGYEAQFAFFLHDVLDLMDKRRVFTLSREDFLNINPNTKTCPVFRTKQDAELTKKIYSYVPVLINEDKNQNPWEVSFKQGLFNMSSDSHLFKEEGTLINEGFKLYGNRYLNDEGEIYLPLYESKMIWHYDHRFGSYEGVDSRSSTHIKHPTEKEYQNPEYLIKPWYWVDSKEVDKVIESKWFLGFRDIARTTDERTGIFSCFPYSGISNKLPIILKKGAINNLLFYTFLTSINFDFFIRQKIGSTSLNFYLVKQFPTITYIPTKLLFIQYASELVYTSWDIKALIDNIWKEADKNLRLKILEQWLGNKKATGGFEWQIPDWHEAYPEIHWDSPLKDQEMGASISEELKKQLIEYNEGCPLPPFKWDKERRENLRVELDAYYALLYGLERDELRYILDPKEVHGEDFPSESFRVLKEKEIRKHGEYRTRRLILEAYDRLRPDWDMKAHKKKLKEVWEKYQEDLSEEKEEPKQKKKTSTNKAEEPKEDYGQGKLEF
ncbi:MAG: hypothetical protein ACOCP4_02530, partial [Candidatus Woesearchaeota archaeon]